MTDISTHTIYTQTFPTPAGVLIAMATDDKLICCDWVEGWHRDVCEARINKALKGPVVEKENAVIKKLKKELAEYFSGKRKTFDLDILFIGTEFQKEVWNALTKIPYGGLTTYGGLAKEIGRPKAVRAIGGAVGQNPCSIVVPCHRVIGADGSMTGFGGGYEAKEVLLTTEGHKVVKDGWMHPDKWRIQ